MPDRPLSLSWRTAAVGLEATLRELTEQVPERLDRATINSCYPTRDWAAVWRVSVMFSDRTTRRIDVVATRAFPTAPVRTALVDHPDFMTWPHVESDGILCLLPNMAECDPDDPSAVASNLLNRSVRLIEELLEGSIVDRDFREEFVTYWAYKAQLRGATFYSLIAPTPPSRRVKIWRGHGVEVVGEDAASLAQWVRRRFGDKANTKTEDAVYLWLDEPLLPAAYPETASDLFNLIATLGDEPKALLEEVAASQPDHIIALLGAIGRGGAALIGVKVPNPKSVKPRPRSAAEPLSTGFRRDNTPQSILMNRFFGSTPVVRTLVQRADANWIHGRDRDPRSEHLLQKTVILVGCGSVGAPISAALAQAGVGRIVLVDHDVLSWPNVGRHPLGASAVGRNKSEALSERLQADFPHLQIEHRSFDLHRLLSTEHKLLENADLIIAATGSWAAESALNRWHINTGRVRPILYGWTEAHACAGHGVVVASMEGCLQCQIGRTGAPSLRVVDWPNGGDASQEEPACGAHYQPYGPIELSYITAMLSELALDCLLQPPRRSFSRVFASPRDRITSLGGRFSEAWSSHYGDQESAVRIVDRPWQTGKCRACNSSACGG